MISFGGQKRIKQKRQPLIFNELAFNFVLPQGLEPWTH
jgi:hypothetical protein